MHKITKFEIVALSANIPGLIGQYLMGNHYIGVLGHCLFLLCANFMFFILGVLYRNRVMVIAELFWLTSLCNTLYENLNI